MKTHPTMQSIHAESLVYEPVNSELADPAVRLSYFIKLIAQMAIEPQSVELPVIV